jgi:23S rRNA U2552 (ribose-2'-O)-methylase RlmE/FtsJ
MDNHILCDMLGRIIEEANIEPVQAKFLRETLVEEMKSRILTINVDLIAHDMHDDVDAIERYMLGRLFEEVEQKKLYKFTAMNNGKYNMSVQVGRF